MRDLLVILIVLGSTPITLVKPYVGVLAWNWLSLMNPHRLTWGYAAHFRVALVVGVATIVAWLISREPKRPPGMSIVYILAAFTLWICVTTWFAMVPDAAQVKWDQAVKILVMTFVSICLINTRYKIHALVWVAVISLGFYGIKGGIFTVATGGGHRVFGPPLSFISDNNQLALALVMTLPLMRYLQLMAERQWVRLGLWATMGLTVIAIVATYSRGGFLALAVVVSLLWVLSKHRFAVGALLAVALVGVVLWLPEQWFARMYSIGNYAEDMSARGRFEAWTFAFKLALDHPIMGGGFRVFESEGLFYRYVPGAITSRNFHSIYFEVLAENGFVGLALFLGLGVAVLSKALWIVRQTGDRPDLQWANVLAKMTMVSMIGFATAGAFLNLGFFDYYYTLIAVVVSTVYLVQRELGLAPAEAAGAAQSFGPLPARTT